MSASVQPDTSNPKAARITLGVIASVVVLLGAVGGIVVAVIAMFALLGAPLFAVMGGASELAWLTHVDPD